MSDEWLAEDMEAAADAANAAASPDWETIGAIERQARILARYGALTIKAIDELLATAERAAAGHKGVLDELASDIRALYDDLT